MKILKQLKNLRLQRSLSQRDLAAMSGVAYESIGQLERGERRARPSTIRKLADALGVEPAVLFNESAEDMWSRTHRESDKQRAQSAELGSYFLEKTDKRRQENTRQVLGKMLKDKSLAELAAVAELVEVEESSEVVLTALAEPVEVSELLGAIRSELEQRPRSNKPYSDPEFDQWIHANRGYMEWYVAGREPNRKYASGACGATMNGDLAIARAKLNSGVAGELEESAQLAAQAIQELVACMAKNLELELRAYEALPSHYFEDPSAARRIGEIGTSMASSQLQDLKMLREFNVVRDQALLQLSIMGPVGIQRKYPDARSEMNISERQQKVLNTVFESGEVGPSTVAERLDISVSTAYRDLSVLEEHGLVAGTESGKREITPLGRDVAIAIANAIATRAVERRFSTNEST